jgi:ADP-heptose:LPS heptosyltransferase
MNSINWQSVRRVLVVRLRSIGDTVLATPSLVALKKFLPDAEIDILLEDWVAPLLDGFDEVDNVLTVGKGSASRLQTAWAVRRRRYDIAFNLHGGTTGTFFTFASGAPHRVGYAEYQYSFLYNHLLSSSSDFWQKPHTHSAEQQLALLGSVGVPVDSPQRTRLTVTDDALESLERKLTAEAQRRRVRTGSGSDRPPVRTTCVSGWVLPGRGDFALFHPTAAFATKTWAVENFARAAEYLNGLGLQTIAIATKNERDVLDQLTKEANASIITFDDLTLPEITALASKAKLFVGNDSGIAHIAAAVDTPSVVIFGSSNINHWRPWTYAPNEIVYNPFACQPCPGYECKEFGEPRCIRSVTVDAVNAAIDRVLKQSKVGAGSDRVLQSNEKGEPEGPPLLFVGGA